MNTDLNKRYQTLVILWFAMMMNIVIFFLIALFVAPQSDGSPANSLVMFALAGLATFLVVMSFAIKRKLLERSVVNQDVSMVQKALVVACAMCEAAALLGLLERFMMKTNDFYLFFFVAAVGTALHFPKREQIEAASYKGPSGGPTL
jgi:hypothetical protein